MSLSSFSKLFETWDPLVFPVFLKSFPSRCAPLSGSLSLYLVGSSQSSGSTWVHLHNKILLFLAFPLECVDIRSIVFHVWLSVCWNKRGGSQCPGLLFQHFCRLPWVRYTRVWRLLRDYNRVGVKKKAHRLGNSWVIAPSSLWFWSTFLSLPI